MRRWREPTPIELNAAHAGNPVVLGGLYSAYDATKIAGIADGGGIGTLYDTATGRNLTQAVSGQQPTLDLDGLGTDKPSMRVLGSDNEFLGAATASDWTFLHDGSPWTLWFVMSVPTANPDAGYALLSTFGLTTSQHGFGMTYDDRSSVSRLDRLGIYMGNGTTLVYEELSNDGALPTQQTNIIVVRHLDGATGGELVAKVNGATVITANSSGHSGTAPHGALRMGRTTTGALQADMNVGEFGVLKRALSDDEITALGNHLADKW